jgi:hypothetical protein
MKKFILLTNFDPEIPGNTVVDTEIISSIRDEEDCTCVYAISGGEEIVVAEVKESASEIYSMLQ